MNIPRPIFYAALICYFGTMVAINLVLNGNVEGTQSLYRLLTMFASGALGLLTLSRLNACRNESVVRYRSIEPVAHEQAGLVLKGFGMGDYGYYVLVSAFIGYNLAEHAVVNTISTGALSYGTAILAFAEAMLLYVALSQIWDMLTSKVQKFAHMGESSATVTPIK